MTRGEAAVHFWDQIKAEDLSFDEVQGMWHAAAFWMAENARNQPRGVIVERMKASLDNMPSVFAVP